MSKPRLQEIIGYDCEVSTPNGPAVHGFILARWMDEAQERFDAWLEEHDRQVAERAWDEGVEATWNPDGTRNLYTENPYRDAHSH